MRLLAAALAALLAMPASALAAADTGVVASNASPTTSGVTSLPFPTAKGFGAAANWKGTGLVVYPINSTADVVGQSDGKVTLRECVEARAISETNLTIAAGKPRVCVFNAGTKGLIRINSPLVVTTSKLYIAGQTASLDGPDNLGVHLTWGDSYGTGASPNNQIGPILKVGDGSTAVTDIVIRYVSFLGKQHGYYDYCLGDGYYECTVSPRLSPNGEALRVDKASRVILDHVNVAYGTDQSLDLYGCTDCTVQYSIIGPGLCGDSTSGATHHAGHTTSGVEDYHCKPNWTKPSKNLTYYMNVMMHGWQRGMNLACGTARLNYNGTSGSDRPVAGDHGQIDFINNVVYNFKYESALISNEQGSCFVNMVGNTFLKGPQWNGAANYIPMLFGDNATGGFQVFGFKVYTTGNATFRRDVNGLFNNTNTTGAASDDWGFYVYTTGTAKPLVIADYCGISVSGSTVSPDCTTGASGTNVFSTTTPAVAPANAGLNSTGLSIAAADIYAADVAFRAIAIGHLAGGGRDNGYNPTTSKTQTSDNPETYMDTMLDDIARCSNTSWTREWATTYPRTVIWETAHPSSNGNYAFDGDKDGVADSYETTYSISTSNANAFSDKDADGLYNIEEYLNSLTHEDWKLDSNYISHTGSGLDHNGNSLPGLPTYNCGRSLN